MAGDSKPKHLPASVRQRLLNLARQTGEDFNALLGRFATERLLYRLSRSPQADRFVLKGAWLFYAWDLQRRGTRDVDLLGFGDPTVEAAALMLAEVLSVEVEPDGIRFDPGTIRGERIRDGAAYSGTRLRVTAFIGAARIVTQIDIGYGDAVAVEPAMVELPSLLDFPSLRLRAYAPETAVAEKLEAIVRFGTATTRFKDFFDLFVLAEEKSFEGELLRDQIRDTFARRGTALPEQIATGGLSDSFAEDPQSQRQWSAFLRRSGGQGTVPDEFAYVIETIRRFATPVFRAARGEGAPPAGWIPGEGWDEARA